MIRTAADKVARIVFRNFGYKLLSLFLAVIVWAIIQGEQVQEIGLDILVSIHVAPEYGIRGELLQVKAATVRGPQVWLLEVPKKLTADIYLSPGKIGGYRIRLSKDDIKNLNERLEVIIHEPYLDLFVDRLIERTIPVKEAIHGTPADGYIVEKVSIEPKTVGVKGIRKDVQSLRYIFTEPVDVSGLSESRVLDVKLVSPGFGADALLIEQVRLNLQVGDSKINKRFSNIPIEIVGGEKGASVKPQFASVLVQGVPSLLSSLRRTDFKAFVEVRGLKPGNFEQDIHVKIPADTALIETIPEKGMVSIEKE